MDLFWGGKLRTNLLKVGVVWEPNPLHEKMVNNDINEIEKLDSSTSAPIYKLLVLSFLFSIFNGDSYTNPWW